MVPVFPSRASRWVSMAAAGAALGMVLAAVGGHWVLAVALGMAALHGVLVLRPALGRGLGPSLGERDRQRRLLRIARERAARLLAERNEARGATTHHDKALATMGHEVRAPLNGVIGLSEILLDSELDEEQRALAEGVHRSGEHLLALVDRILDGAKAEHARQNRGDAQIELAPLNLGELLDDLTAPLWGRVDRSRVEVRGQFETTGPRVVVGDPMRLRQIGHNLTSNAARFTEDGAVDVTVGFDGSDLWIVVSDTGPGIPADRVEEIFEPYRQADGGVERRSGGTGLGLTIARGLAESMGGELTVESTLGEGSTFAARIPARAFEVHEPAAPLPAAPSLPEVLIVEDDAVSTRVLLQMLRRRGLPVRAAATIDAALDAIEIRRPDVVMLDLELAEESGLDILPHLSGGGARPAIVCISGNEPPAGAPFDAHVRKPFTGPELDRALAALWQRTPMARGA